MQLITTLLTIIGSGIAAAAMTYVLNARREQVFFMRKKAEELYIAFDRFEKLVSALSLRGLMLIQGSIDDNYYKEAMMKEEPAETRDAHQNMSMLISIYYTSCLPAYDDFYKARGQLIKIINNYQKITLHYEDQTENYVIDYNQALDTYATAAINLRKSIVGQAQLLADEDALWPTALRWSAARGRISGAVRLARSRIRDRIARVRAAGSEE